MSDLRIPDPIAFVAYLNTDNEVTVEIDPPPSGGIAGWTVRCQLLKADGTLADDKTVGDGIVIADPTRSWRITISPDIDGLTVGDGYLWFRRTDPGARVVIVQGPLSVVVAGG